MERVKEATGPFDNLKMDSVHPLPLKTLKAKEDYQGGPFWVLARKESIQRYPCNKCHKDKEAVVRRGAELAHGDIRMAHGKGDDALTCNVCHHRKERDLLIDKHDREIDLDHSYQLCGQCHFRQKTDWLGGAHGKRVKYWAGKRVVKNCTNCHDAHAPRFEKRWPKTYSLPLDE